MRLRFLLLAFIHLASSAPAADPADWQQRHDKLVARFRALATTEGRWGPAWQPIYHAALPWFEQQGGNPRHDVDDWMSPPEDYATELADALEQGRNFFAENPGALIPLVFVAHLPDGRTVTTNYWLSLPDGFARDDRKFPLVIGLHGSGWLAHKISFVRRARKDASGSRTFSVTPINEAGPWQIEFLNAYLDELQRILPVDPDRVYLEGHSLGAMATWEWALNNPERFAAISPRAGRGEPYRAARLRNVPAWVIHGEKDPSVFTGFSDQMVTALEACGGRVRYTVIPGLGHNMPEDLDESQVVDWYLQQTRSHEPPPPDPREQLGLTPAGFSPWEVVTDPAETGWRSASVPMANQADGSRAVLALFDHVHARGERADAPIVMELDPRTNDATFWLAQPKTLHASAPADPTLMTLPAGRSVRFYFRGPTGDALARVAKVAAEARTAGYRVQNRVRISPLSLWAETPGYLAEYRIRID